MFELGQFHLQLALMGTGALGEDVEDQSGAIEHAAFQRTLEVTLLTGGQSVIEDDQFDLASLHKVAKFFDLAAADQELG
ncbi:hypothetical protein D3C76_1251680 [compost metagenome]